MKIYSTLLSVFVTVNKTLNLKPINTFNFISISHNNSSLLKIILIKNKDNDKDKDLDWDLDKD